ncbi:YrhB domain-containing protein [Kitasatospora sp. NPDC048296]|uniref:YrhB domain-containing protein n=1 Tax=Kitasatospora sp. NPDC048296 TaxID=3364048 RepID=UPI0037190B05
MNATTDRTRAWLRQLYGPVVDLATDQPVAETEQAWWYALRALPESGYKTTPMLNASIVVPKDGSAPFHPGNSDPWGDAMALAQNPGPRTRQDWENRVNARSCVVAVDAAIDQAAVSMLPWQPWHEAPGWWGRLIRRYFAGAEVGTCADWDEVLSAVGQGGQDARGVVRVRRELGGFEATGHLLYAYNDGSRVVVLDGQSGGLARLDTTGVRQLTLARFHRPRGGVPAVSPPWRRTATDLASAVAKAEAWLAEHYRGEVVLVDHGEQDDLGRGWLFACNNRAFLASGDWSLGMLDAAVVVPKDDTSPFGLPNTDPWGWLDRWLADGVPGVDEMALPPAPGQAAWFAPTLARLGAVLETVEFADWLTAMAGVVRTPDGARMLAWVRRRDRRGRESVGRLIAVAHTSRGPVLLDVATGEGADMELDGVISVRITRYR